MDAVAAEAGVGKGTLFRRFGDRASLARAVISEHETELQDELIRGAPPLGPGAPAARAPDRLRRAPTWSSSSATATLLLAAEGSHDALPARAAAYAFYRTHVALLLREAGCGDRADYLADVAARPAGRADLHVPPRAARGSRSRSWSRPTRTSCARLLDSPR